LQFVDPRKVYPTLLDALVNDPNVDAIAMQVPSRAFHIPRGFFQFFPESLKAQKPVALWVAGIPSGRMEVLEWLEEQNIPVFPNPEKVIRALAALRRSSLYKLPGAGGTEKREKKA
jgi:acyl-CoA synthetase (NDP forming)